MVLEGMSELGGLEELSQSIVECRLCPRLVEFRERVAREKVRRFRDWEYWGRPLAGFGDPDAELLIVGLAPAAHGGNRTGRMFTGDSSGDWLFRALYEVGLSNIPKSERRDDGLQLRRTYITAALRCPPPSNRPLAQELENCSQYLKAELDLLRRVRVVLTLGRIAFQTYLKCSGIRGLLFRHGGEYALGHGRWLLASYHPSRQNTQTGRLSWEDWMRVFRRAVELLDPESSG